MSEDLIHADGGDNRSLEKSGEDLPFVVSSGQLKMGAMTVTVHNLSSGQRVIDAADMATLLSLLDDRTDDAKNAVSE